MRKNIQATNGFWALCELHCGLASDDAARLHFPHNFLSTNDWLHKSSGKQFLPNHGADLNQKLAAKLTNLRTSFSLVHFPTYFLAFIFLLDNHLVLSKIPIKFFALQVPIFSALLKPEHAGKRMYSTTWKFLTILQNINECVRDRATLFPFNRIPLLPRWYFGQCSSDNDGQHRNNKHSARSSSYFALYRCRDDQQSRGKRIWKSFEKNFVGVSGCSEQSESRRKKMREQVGRVNRRNRFPAWSNAKRHLEVKNLLCIKRIKQVFDLVQCWKTKKKYAYVRRRECTLLQSFYLAYITKRLVAVVTRWYAIGIL